MSSVELITSAPAVIRRSSAVLSANTVTLADGSFVVVDVVASNANTTRLLLSTTPSGASASVRSSGVVPLLLRVSFVTLVVEVTSES